VTGLPGKIYRCIYIYMTTSLDPALLKRVSTECVCANLRRASRAVSQVYDRLLGPTGLRGTQVSVLVALGRAGAAPSAKIAGYLGMDPTTLSRNLAPLIRAKLVVSTSGAPDRRVKLVTLTSAGREKLAAALPYWEAAQREMVDALGRDRWTPLRAELTELTTIAGAVAS
jgi:DNA-binding MarR family transcriptional regulator